MQRSIVGWQGILRKTEILENWGTTASHWKNRHGDRYSSPAAGQDRSVSTSTSKPMAWAASG